MGHAEQTGRTPFDKRTGVAGAVLVLALTLGPGAAWSARPLYTEDASIQPRGDCMVDSYLGRLKPAATDSDTDISRSGSTQLSCGIGRGTQVALGYSESRAGGMATRSLLLSGKTALIDAKDDGTGASVVYGVPAEQTTHAPTRVGESFVTLAGTLSLAPSWLVHANLGWNGSLRTGRNTSRWALALEHAVTEGTTLLAETFGDDRDHHPWLQIGVSTQLTPHVSLNGSYGQQTFRHPGRALTLGVVVTF